MALKSTKRLQPILEEIEYIRRKNRLAKYRPKGRRVRKEEKKANGRPLALLPPQYLSPEFKAILKYFIQPLLNNIESGAPTQRVTIEGDDGEVATAGCLSLEQKIDILFCVATRDIVPAVLIEEVTRMPGLVVQEDGVRRPPTVSEAKFPKGTPVFVRIDDVNKLKVEIENCEKPDLLFELTVPEYKAILDKLREIEGCNYRLDPPGEIRQKDGSFTAVI